jgi:hypothetical protein
VIGKRDWTIVLRCRCVNFCSCALILLRLFVDDCFVLSWLLGTCTVWDISWRVIFCWCELFDMFCMFMNEFCRCVAAVGDDCELKRGCRVVNDHAMWYVWYLVQPDVLYDFAGLAGYISVEHRAVPGCLTVIVLECSISNTLLILVCYNTYWVIEYFSLYVLWTITWRFKRWIFVWVTRISTIAHCENLEMVTRKFLRKMMKKDFQTLITFEILLGNWIFTYLRIMENPLRVFKIDFSFG